MTAMQARVAGAVVAVLSAMGMAGCAGVAPSPAPPVPAAAPTPPPAPKAPVAPPAPTATPGLSPRERIRLALELLGQGQAKAPQAKAELQAFLAEQPDNPLGRSLLEQIDKDPTELLGAQSFTYTVRSGETLSSLAERFLGDRFRFYALARYNHLDTPRQAVVGQVLKIPGASPPPTARAPRKPTPRPSDEALIAARVKEAPAPAPAPPPPRPAADPERAARLRAAALPLLGRGQAAKAAALLQEAARLDPGNALIRADLARALRLRDLR